MTSAGFPFLLIAVPWVVGSIVCSWGGFYIACRVTDWAVDRTARSLGLYAEILAVAKQRITEKRRRNAAND